MVRNKRLRSNLIAISTIFSATIFSYYLLDFYVKYFPGSVFVNKGLFGIFDGAAFFYIQLIQLKCKKVPTVIRVVGGSVIVLSGTYIVFNGFGVCLAILPVIIGLIRMHITSIQSYCCHAN